MLLKCYRNVNYSQKEDEEEEGVCDETGRKKERKKEKRVKACELCMYLKGLNENVNHPK